PGLPRDRAGGFGPLWPRVLGQRLVGPDPVADRIELLADSLVDQRLDLRRHVDAGAGHVEAGVAEVDLRPQIRLEMPGRRKFRPRGDGDATLDLGAGVQRLDVDGA